MKAGKAGKAAEAGMVMLEYAASSTRCDFIQIHCPAGGPLRRHALASRHRHFPLRPALQARCALHNLYSMHQLILDLLPETPPSLDNFVVGSNGEALAGLAGWLAADSRETLLLLWGEPASGKTHLLRASGARYIDAQDDRALAGLEAAESGDDTMATTTPESIPGIPTRASPVRYAIDNIEALDERGQIALFNLFNRLRATNGAGRLLAAAAAPPQQLTVREDLRTRLGSGLVYRLQPLSEAEQDAALTAQAARRGLRLPTGALAYLRSRAPRDMRSLSALLDALDRYSLERRRPITLPLLREVLHPAPHTAAFQNNSE